MLTDFLLEIAITATALLIWRALLLDYARLLAYVESIPFIGSALRCGFCMAIWASLIAIALYDPLASLHPAMPFLERFFIDWFAFAAVILFVRNLLAILIEGTGVLTHLHHAGHTGQVQKK